LIVSDLILCFKLSGICFLYLKEYYDLKFDFNLSLCAYAYSCMISYEWLVCSFRSRFMQVILFGDCVLGGVWPFVLTGVFKNFEFFFCFKIILFWCFWIVLI
jgi:hypothetical protein